MVSPSLLQSVVWLLSPKTTIMANRLFCAISLNSLNTQAVMAPPHSETGGKKPALKMTDLARMAGVSKSTVSRALQNSELVNLETREKIQALAKEHNYRLNTQARNFRLKESFTIGVVIPSAENARWQVNDPFFLELLGSISFHLIEQGHEMLLSGLSLHAVASGDDGLRRINCDGLIVAGQADCHEDLNRIADGHTPMVVWGAELPDQRYCTVGGDNRRGGELATEHLLQQGCKRIAIIGDWGTPEGLLRYQGYQQALLAASISPEPLLAVSVSGERDSHRQAAMRLLTSGEPFDGLFCLSDAIAMAAINALNERGVSVPGRVAVVGYDDISLARYYTPAITSIYQDRELGGRWLVDKLLRMLDGEAVESSLLPTTLIERRSSQR